LLAAGLAGELVIESGGNPGVGLRRGVLIDERASSTTPSHGTAPWPPDPTGTVTMSA